MRNSPFRLRFGIGELRAARHRQASRTQLPHPHDRGLFILSFKRSGDRSRSPLLHRADGASGRQGDRLSGREGCGRAGAGRLARPRIVTLDGFGQAPSVGHCRAWEGWRACTRGRISREAPQCTLDKGGASSSRGPAGRRGAGLARQIERARGARARLAQLPWQHHADLFPDNVFFIGRTCRA